MDNTATETTATAPTAAARTSNLGRRCRVLCNGRLVAAIVSYEYTELELTTTDAAGRKVELAPFGMVDLTAFPRGESPYPFVSVYVDESDWLEA